MVLTASFMCPPSCCIKCCDQRFYNHSFFWATWINPLFAWLIFLINKTTVKVREVIVLPVSTMWTLCYWVIKADRVPVPESRFSENGKKSQQYFLLDFLQFSSLCDYQTLGFHKPAFWNGPLPSAVDNRDWEAEYVWRCSLIRPLASCADTQSPFDVSPSLHLILQRRPVDFNLYMSHVGLRAGWVLSGVCFCIIVSSSAM